MLEKQQRLQGQDLAALRLVAQDRSAEWADRIAAGNLVCQREGTKFEIPLQKLQYQAGILGVEAGQELVVVRQDSRSVQQVLATGFAPNPKSADGTIFDHIGKKGTNQYVSCSLAAGNENVARMLAHAGFVEYDPTQPENQKFEAHDAERLLAHQEIERAIVGLHGEARSQAIQRMEDAFLERPGDKVFYRHSGLWEYACSGVEGMRVPDMRNYRFGLEDEVVTLGVTPDKIVAMRRLIQVNFFAGLNFKENSGLYRGGMMFPGAWIDPVGGTTSLSDAGNRAVMLLDRRQAARIDAGFCWDSFRLPGFSWEKKGAEMRRCMIAGDAAFEGPALKMP